jgi:hypothetical protein
LLLLLLLLLLLIKVVAVVVVVVVVESTFLPLLLCVDKTDVVFVPRRSRLENDVTKTFFSFVVIDAPNKRSRAFASSEPC